MRIKKLLIISGLIFFIGTDLNAQAVLENHRLEVYNFLYRMAQKGKIEFDDLITPVSRTEINKQLIILSDSSATLSSVEKKELNFYLQEYRSVTPDKEGTRFFKKDPNGRWRAFSAYNPSVQVHVDPILSGAIVSGKYSYTRRISGGQFWGTAGKHFGFYFQGKDITEKGTKLDRRMESDETGIVLQSDTTNKKEQNFSEIRAGISYQWNTGQITVGQDHFQWGYGNNGKIVFSDRAPAYPFIRLDYRPFKWLKFNYTHAFLHSNIIDSSRTYSFGDPDSVFGNQRTQYVPKYYASHSISIIPTKGLEISVGENMIYADKLDIGYLIPVSLFKIYDNIQSHNNILAGGNGQFFFQVSSRNQIKNTHLYATLLIDEIKFASVLKKKESRNQVAFNIGASATDLFIPYLTISAEYARVNPFVYRNLNPAENYTNHGFLLGHWMGNNADQFLIDARYTPVAKLKLQLRYQYLRKGGPGTITQQYFSQPQPAFLFDFQRSQSEVFGKASYEWLNNLFIQTSFRVVNEKNKFGIISHNNQFMLGVVYGL